MNSSNMYYSSGHEETEESGGVIVLRTGLGDLK